MAPPLAPLSQLEVIRLEVIRLEVIRLMVIRLEVARLLVWAVGRLVVTRGVVWSARSCASWGL